MADVRELFRQKALGAVKKIEAPLAKYNATGHLICIACNLHIKAEKLWTAHTQGAAHKERAAALQGGEPPAKVARQSEPEAPTTTTTTTTTDVAKAPNLLAAPKQQTTAVAGAGQPPIRELPAGFFDTSVTVPKVTAKAATAAAITPTAPRLAPRAAGQAAEPAESEGNNNGDDDDSAAAQHPIDERGEEDRELEADLLQRLADEEADQTLLHRRLHSLKEQQQAALLRLQQSGVADRRLGNSSAVAAADNDDDDDDDDEDEFDWRKRGL